MAKGISIHIGINNVDSTHYADENGQPWDGALVACEFDAKDMQKLAKSKKFEAQLLLTQQATAANVSAAITHAASKLQSGDMFLLSYSGHGGQVDDKNNEENDGKDETWVLYDRELLDDELYVLWSQFKKGVRILVLSDSCHSGTVTKAIQMNMLAKATGETFRFRGMPPEAARKTYQKNKKLYDGLQAANPKGDKVKVNARVLLFSGCQDQQFSQDGDRNGLFTENLKKALKKGAAKNYKALHKQIATAMPPWQVPNYFATGAANPTFEAQKPFVI
jgi:metacaspase-1